MHCLSIARALLRQGTDLTLIQVSDTIGDELQFAPMAVRAAPPSRIHYLLDGVGVLRAVQSICEGLAIAAVVGWSHEAAFLPGYLRRSGIPFGMIAAFDYGLLDMRRTRFRAVKALADHWFRMRPLRRADVVFAPSDYSSRQLIEVMGVDPSNVRKAHLGVDPRFLEIPRALRSAASRFVFFGELTEVKGIRDLLLALARVRELGGSSWELQVAGWGDVESLRDAASELGIIEQVRFLGRLDHQELRAVLEWADLAILPSRAESFGLSIAEAQAAGLPVISCKTGAVPEIVDDGSTGWLVEPGDTEALASAVLAAMSEPELAFRMGMDGRKRVATKFTWKTTAEQMMEGLLRRTTQDQERARSGAGPGISPE